MWQWVCDVHADRAVTVPEGVRRAAQRVGFAFDSFASVEDEAGRLARHLDARDAGGGGRCEP